jgi:hypothetical protein
MHTSLTHRVVLIALLGIEDFWKEFEETIPAGILITRALRDLKFELKLESNLEELYNMSLPFENFEEKLFGPQEEELGDDGMNPLRFAKLSREKTKSANDLIESALSGKMTHEALKTSLRMRGKADTGTKEELVKRFVALKRKDIEDIASGSKLSGFGNEMVSKIFAAIKNAALPVASESSSSTYTATTASATATAAGVTATGTAATAANDTNQSLSLNQGQSFSSTTITSAAVNDTPSLSLWDINRYLQATGAPATMYDRDEYRQMLADLELFADKKGCLTKEGLRSYYEAFGRLSSDVKDLAIGSLDDSLKGAVKLAIEYETEAFESMLGLLEAPTSSHPSLKALLVTLSSLNDTFIDGEYEKLGKVLEVLQQLMGFLGGPDVLSTGVKSLLQWSRSPGWLAATVHQLAAALGDREEGLIRSLRHAALQEFGRYDRWDNSFKQFFASLEVGNYLNFLETATSVPMPLVGQPTGHFIEIDAEPTLAANNNNGGDNGENGASQGQPLLSSSELLYSASSQVPETPLLLPGMNNPSSPYKTNPATAAATAFNPRDLASRCNAQPANEDSIAFIRGKLRDFLPPLEEDSRGLQERIRQRVKDADRILDILSQGMDYINLWVLY